PSHHFFYKAQDGIRDYKVTGVQTCALPILGAIALQMVLIEQPAQVRSGSAVISRKFDTRVPHPRDRRQNGRQILRAVLADRVERSEERRVGKGGRWVVVRVCQKR